MSCIIYGAPPSYVARIETNVFFTPSMVPQAQLQETRGANHHLRARCHCRSGRRYLSPTYHAPNHLVLLRQALRSVLPDAEELADEDLGLLFMKIDANGSGDVDWDEFTGFLLQARILSCAVLHPCLPVKENLRLRHVSIVDALHGFEATP